MFLYPRSIHILTDLPISHASAASPAAAEPLPRRSTDRRTRAHCRHSRRSCSRAAMRLSVRYATHAESAGTWKPPRISTTLSILLVLICSNYKSELESALSAFNTISLSEKQQYTHDYGQLSYVDAIIAPSIHPRDSRQFLGTQNNQDQILTEHHFDCFFRPILTLGYYLSSNI